MPLMCAPLLAVRACGDGMQGFVVLQSTKASIGGWVPILRGVRSRMDERVQARPDQACKQHMHAYDDSEARTPHSVGVALPSPVEQRT